jgi:hypothetical protein
MSYQYLPSTQHTCDSPIYGDAITRWSTRPQFYSSGNAGDMEWMKTPLQPPYLGTDMPHMSTDLNMYNEVVNGKGRLKPEVTPDPCYPTPIKYFSFGKPVWRYDRNYPSLTIPYLPCTYRAKSTLPDVACLDQQQLSNKDRLNQNIPKPPSPLL